ncbi:radical SAM protein [Streptomyces montanisoli]|uniref:Radical SAM protein n=1 Tax=Streptomyces montanisoli TaxID=2798581 RepID=A0A940RVU6_9ACTN|nr:radical SAM protein [Streptomyces montanisoli]MBP0458740.1 radical SAM protein [Streptomyces montanisoli]
MELAELVALRPVPCAGVLLMVTQRCPLHCAHCSTSSTMAGAHADGSALLRLVESFGPADRPELLMLTGGEPLLRPRLVTELAEAARARGVRTALLSGAFFARGGRLPASIRRAVRAVDHFSASIDRQHEREVPRTEVLRVLGSLLEDGTAVSLHITGADDDDPYLADVTREVRLAFGDRVPMLVNEVRAVGRAAAWGGSRTVPPAAAPGTARPLPCAMAAWPVVTPDGAVLACGNQDAVDLRPVPEHLLLGHIPQDDWPTLRGRALASPELRLIRSLGPLHLRSRFGAGTSGAQASGDGASGPGPCGADGYCASCVALPRDPELREAVRGYGAGPAGELLDAYAARAQARSGPVALVRRFGSARYAGLVAPGGPR